jgi:hypothetical protein
MRKRLKLNSNLIITLLSITLASLVVGIVLLLIGPNSQAITSNDDLKLLKFGQDTYESSKQAEELKLDWNRYPTLPSDISLICTFMNDEPYFTIRVPDWEMKKHGSSFVFHNQPVYIAVTVRETRNDLFKETVKNLVALELLDRFNETEGTILTIGNLNVTKSVGSCISEGAYTALRQYASYTFKEGSYQYCLVGITTFHSDTAIEHLTEALEEMIASISLEGFSGEIPE